MLPEKKTAGNGCKRIKGVNSLKTGKNINLNPLKKQSGLNKPLLSMVRFHHELKKRMWIVVYK
jgi:hypothetical protein